MHACLDSPFLLLCSSFLMDKNIIFPPRETHMNPIKWNIIYSLSGRPTGAWRQKGPILLCPSIFFFHSFMSLPFQILWRRAHKQNATLLASGPRKPLSIISRRHYFYFLFEKQVKKYHFTCVFFFHF